MVNGRARCHLAKVTGDALRRPFDLEGARGFVTGVDVHARYRRGLVVVDESINVRKRHYLR